MQVRNNLHFAYRKGGMSIFEKEKDISSGKGEDDVTWITVKGRHIPIKDGENIEDVINEHFKNTRKAITLPKQEYAELCSAIRTKYGNKIPKSGDMLYNNYYYVYNYNKNKELILFREKIEIENNQERIRILEGNNVK